MHADTDHEHVSPEFDCTVCGCERLPVRADQPVRCPDCDQPYSLLRHERFAMVEVNGWICRVAVEPRDDELAASAGE